MRTYLKKRRITNDHHFLQKNRGPEKTSKPLKILVFASGFEPLAYRLGGGRSIQLSYANISQLTHYITKVRFHKEQILQS